MNKRWKIKLLDSKRSHKGRDYVTHLEWRVALLEALIDSHTSMFDTLSEMYWRLNAAQRTENELLKKALTGDLVRDQDATPPIMH